MTGTTATTTRAVDTPPRSTAATPLIRAIKTDADFQAWSRYVERSPGGTLFHHPQWCRCVEDVFGHEPRHLAGWRDGRCVGVLPLLELRSALAGLLLVSVPYGTYGGVLADDDAAGSALLSAAFRYADRCGARSVELRSAQPADPALIDDQRYASFVKRLPLEVNALRTFLPRKARAAARQARDRDGLTARHDAALLPTVWRLYARSMRRLGSIAYPYRFFAALLESLGSRAWVTVVFRDERPVAGLLSFVFRDTVLPYFAGLDERVRCPGAANLIYLSAMERAVRSGLTQFDFGRTRRENSGPFAFKTNQGFEPRTLGYQRYVPPGRTAPDLTPSNPRFALARRVWPRLPLCVTTRVGGWLSRSIPG